MTHIQKIILVATLWLGGCVMIGPIDTSLSANPPLVKPNRAPVQNATGPAVGGGTASEPSAAQTIRFFKTPVTPMTSSGLPATQPVKQAPVNATDETISAVTLDGLPLPQFINTIYATILKRNVSLDPAVQSRTDLVSLRTGKPQTAAQLSAAAQTVLRSYAVSVNEFEGLVRAVPSSGVGGASPEILRGRAQPDVPSSLRPIFYLAELDNTSQANVVTWVRTLFQGRVTVTEDPPRNAIMLSGQSDSVMAAVDAIQTLDRPGMRGRYSARLTPVFWSAVELSSRLVDVLSAQGYSASQNTLSPAPILILPIAPINSVIVFAVSEEALNHTLRWARELDQTQPTRSGGRFITYYVRHTDASDVAKTLQEVLGGGGVSAAPVAGTAAPVARSIGNSRVVVNAAANSIIIQSTPAEYQQIYGLLQELDRPSRSALIMATVAEVSLTDGEQFGFNWLLSQFKSGGYVINGGMGPAPAGGAVSAVGVALNIATVAGDPRALLTAMATSSRVRVLSNPSIVAISGQQASIQVGEDVPILTSQISNANTGTGTGQGVLQTVQYRNVGIILKVKPTIRAGGRVDLEIAQEVSGVSTASTGLGNSPVVNTRRVETRLSTLDGNTMLIGGLIREQRDGSNSGLPYLKEIPVLGGFFRTSAGDNITRTELVILITPYVMEDDFDSRAITDAFRGQFAWGASLPLSVKEASKPVAEPLADKAPAVAPAPVAQPYAVPNEPVPSAVTAPAARTPTVQPALLPTAVGGTEAPKGKTQAMPASAAPVGPGTGTGKVVTDEKLRLELLEAIRGTSKK